MGAGGYVVVSPPLAVDMAPTIASGLHAAGVAIGNKVILTITTPLKSGDLGPMGLIETVQFSNKDQLAGEIGLLFSATDFVDVGDNVAMAPTVAENAQFVGPVQTLTTDWKNVGAHELAPISNLGLNVRVINKQVFAQFFAITAITFVSTDALKAKILGLLS